MQRVKSYKQSEPAVPTPRFLNLEKLLMNVAQVMLVCEQFCDYVDIHPVSDPTIPDDSSFMAFQSPESVSQVKVFMSRGNFLLFSELSEEVVKAFLSDYKFKEKIWFRPLSHKSFYFHNPSFRENVLSFSCWYEKAPECFLGAYYDTSTCDSRTHTCFCENLACSDCVECFEKCPFCNEAFEAIEPTQKKRKN